MDRQFWQELPSFLEAEILELRSTLGHAWPWLSEVFFVPGVYLLGWLVAWAPLTADFLGVEATDRDIAALLSVVVWIAAFFPVRAGYKVVRGFLASLFYAGQRYAVAAAYRLRMFRWRRAAPMRRIEPRIRADLEEFHIDELQTAILHAQSKLPPGHVITALDVATELAVSPLLAQQALDALKRLDLMEVSFATTDGFPGYLLTRLARFSARPPIGGYEA
jgi:hypothetical protein